MKVLRIIASADPGGGGPIEGVRRSGKFLEELGHEQHVATLDAPDAPWLSEVDFPVIALGESCGAARARGRQPIWTRFGYTPKAVPWLRAHSVDYDVAIVSGLWNYATMAARRALVGGPIPYVVFCHGMLDPWFKRTYPLKSLAKQAIWPFNEGKLLKHAAAVLFTSEQEKLSARGSFHPYRLNERVVGYGTADITGDPDSQVASFRALVPALEQRPFLLFLSRIHRKKGCDLLIEAFAQLAAHYPDLDLVIAGPDEMGLRAKLQGFAASRGISARIHWPGMLQGDRKWGGLRACEAFILPSHQENFGIVVAEAMAAGRPILTTNKVNIWREIQEDGAGIIDSDDVPGVRSLMLRFLNLSQEQRFVMGENARNSFLRRFTIEDAGRDLIEALEEAMATAQS